MIHARSRQRSDSTHVLGAIRAINRLELVGEAMRAARNALAVAAPEWLRGHAQPEWAERYGPRVAPARLPESSTKPLALAEAIGADGRYARKYSIQWVGYKVHLTETCDDVTPPLITHVLTTTGPVEDSKATAAIHAALGTEGLLPRCHIVDE